MRDLVFLFGLLELDLVDFDAHLGVREIRVEGKCVVVVDISALWTLGQDSVFGAGQGLEGSF